MKTMVVGVGAVGSVTAEILAHSDEFDKVILADVNMERAKRAEKKISSDKVDGEEGRRLRRRRAWRRRSRG